jgi:hypothetical protein
MVEQFSDDEKLRCLEREIALRRKVCPGLISKVNMTAKTAFQGNRSYRGHRRRLPRTKVAPKVVEDCAALSSPRSSHVRRNKLPYLNGNDCVLDRR